MDSIWVINSFKNYITEGQDLAWSGDAKFRSGKMKLASGFCL
jgi:hypothetical protein